MKLDLDQYKLEKNRNANGTLFYYEEYLFNITDYSLADRGKVYTKLME